MSTLPSRNHPKPRLTVREDVGVSSKDFVIDPTQDFIGYVSESASFSHSTILLVPDLRFPEMVFSLRAESKFT